MASIKEINIGTWNISTDQNKLFFKQKDKVIQIFSTSTSIDHKNLPIIELLGDVVIYIIKNQVLLFVDPGAIATNNKIPIATCINQLHFRSV